VPVDESPRCERFCKTLDENVNNILMISVLGRILYAKKDIIERYLFGCIKILNSSNDYK
jgi:hypothetical protein